MAAKKKEIQAEKEPAAIPADTKLPAKKKTKKVVRKGGTGHITKNGIDTTIFSFMHKGVKYEMTENQKLFAMEYVRNQFNGTNAAIKAGYSEKAAAAQATRLLSDANISRFVQALKEDVAFRIGVDAVDIAREYKKIGFSDIRKVFDKEGKLINVADLDDEPAANVASIEVFEEFAGAGDNRTLIGYTKKIKLYDKVNALDKLAKMIGADGVTKVAQTDKDGNDVEKPKPVDLSNLSDTALAELAARLPKED